MAGLKVGPAEEEIKLDNKADHEAYAKKIHKKLTEKKQINKIHVTACLKKLIQV